MSDSTPTLRALLEPGRHQSDQYHYAKFRLVTSDPDVLAASGVNADYLNRLSGLSAEAVLDSASTFVWLNVHRLFRRIANDDFGVEFRREVDSLLLTTFDSFLLLPETQTVRLVNRIGRSLVLPCNGLEFEVEGTGQAVLRKMPARTIVASNLSTNEEIWPLGTAVSPVREVLPWDANVLHAKNEELFETVYLHEITGDAVKCEGYRDRLITALEEIRQVDEALAKSLMREVRWYIPIGTTQDEHFFSFTSAMLKDVLFISLHQGSDDLVEAIIHEYHHGALNYFMDTIRVFDPPDDAVYYSPWKTEPRPLSGLFHGLFVFSACLEYYMRADTADGTSRGRYRMARVEDIYYKLRVARHQVPFEALTAEGAALTQACDAIHAAALHRWPTLSEAAPVHIEQHAQEWRQRNPALVLRH